MAQNPKNLPKRWEIDIFLTSSDLRVLFVRKNAFPNISWVKTRNQAKAG